MSGVCFRSNTTYNLPLPSAFGKAVMVNNRLFYVGGISSPASNNIYEWNESSVVMKYYCTVLFRVFGDSNSD